MKSAPVFIPFVLLFTLSACTDIASTAEQKHAQKHYAELKKATPEHVQELKVYITHIPTSEGSIHAGLYDGTLKFPQRLGHLEAQSAEVTADSAVLVFKDVPYGKYAIAVFQDQNNDDILNTNIVGIPQEPIAFSNGAKAGAFGPPNFSEAAFEVNSNLNEIDVAF